MKRGAGLGQFVKNLALVLICILAFSIRLFSVIKYESLIHEFDPYFNYRVTGFLTKNGFYDMWNWFDDRTWYPLGRVIGGTVYPGLLWTAGSIFNILHALNIPLHVQEVCVFTAPLFSAFCALTTYGFVKEVRSEGAGLMAAAFVATVPSYISRSVAGSYDNEGVAIFALINVFNMFLKTVNTGSLFWGMMTVAAYFYMVMSWGGYSFVINLLPIYCLACIFTGKLNSRMYVAFAPLVCIGTLLAASIPVVGFNAVLTSEHFGSFFAFFILHAALLIRWIRGTLPEHAIRTARNLVLTAGAGLLALGIAVVVGFVLRSPTYGWTGRSLSLLDPTYASKYIPIIASVSEHQPPSWPSYLTDLQSLAILAPAGLVACFLNYTDGALFLILYGITAVYFSGVMVRLMLVLAPAACCLAGVAASEMLVVTCGSLKSRPVLPARDDAAIEGEAPVEEKKPPKTPEPKEGVKEKRSSAAEKDKKKKSKKGPAKKYPLSLPVAGAATFLMMVVMVFYLNHCIYVSSEMYSAPSIVLQSHGKDGSVYVFDDFREAYAWLRHNTHPEAKVASWWDYGYQTTAMANRTVIVDNNTWNNTHIATVGRAMSSPEYKAWKIYRYLDVDYVFVVFGGLVGYPSDDINKFLWMVRIGGGVYPEIKEADYLGNGDYRIDEQASKTMLNSLMYKLSYLDFAKAAEVTFGARGYDRVRNTKIGKPNISLKYFEEVFTSQHWMMRIYRVRDKPNRDSSKGKATAVTKGGKSS